MGLGKKIKELLSDRKMTIKELSKKTGISINTLYAITKRDSTNIRDENLIKIADALGVPVEMLLSEIKRQKISFNSYSEYADEMSNLLQEIEEENSKMRDTITKISLCLNHFGLALLAEAAMEIMSDESNVKNEFKNRD